MRRFDADSTQNDPYGIAHFQVEIDGMPESGFLNVTGLEGRVEVEEYREGGDFAGTRKAPGTSPIRTGVRRGMTSSKELWEWWERVRTGDVDRRDVSIKLLDDSEEVVARWNVFQDGPFATPRRTERGSRTTSRSSARAHARGNRQDD